MSNSENNSTIETGLYRSWHSKCNVCCGQLWVRHMFCGRDLWWIIPLHIFHWSCWDTLVFRLHSEIDHIHLSSEAQCDSHQLPPGGLPQCACAWHKVDLMNLRRLTPYIVKIAVLVSWMIVLKDERHWRLSVIWSSHCHGVKIHMYFVQGNDSDT